MSTTDAALLADPTSFAAMRADPERSFWFFLDRISLCEAARRCGTPMINYAERWMLPFQAPVHPRRDPNGGHI